VQDLNSINKCLTYATILKPFSMCLPVKNKQCGGGAGEMKRTPQELKKAKIDFSPVRKGAKHWFSNKAIRCDVYWPEGRQNDQFYNGE